MPGSALPAGPRTAPNALYSGSRLSMQLNTASYSATSTTWPRPLAWRWCSAISTPITPCKDASVSPIDTPTRTGIRPGAPALHRAGAEVLDQHVRLAGEAPHDVLPLGPAQVERERALVARLHLPPDRGAALQQPPAAQRVAAADPRARRVGGRLDLDHVGAEVGQRLRGERAGDQLAELDDLQPGERAGGRRVARGCVG